MKIRTVKNLRQTDSGVQSSLRGVCLLYYNGHLTRGKSVKEFRFEVKANKSLFILG